MVHLKNAKSKCCGRIKKRLGAVQSFFKAKKSSQELKKLEAEELGALLQKFKCLWKNSVRGE